MFPVIAQWHSFTIYSYGLFAAAGFLVVIFWTIRRATRAGLAGFPFFEMGVYGGVSCLLGARLLYVIVNWAFFSRHPGEIIRLWDGGLILYGGYIAFLLFAILFIRASHLPFWKSVDASAPALPLGFALGRLGCFFNGCCYGVRSDTWGISFPSAHQPPVYLQQVHDGLIKAGSPHTLPVLPTQLYSAGADLGILFLLLRLERKERFPGFLFLMFILLYGLVRFVMEFFRYHEAKEMIPALSPLSLSQGISVLTVLAAFLFMVCRWKTQGGAP